MTVTIEPGAAAADETSAGETSTGETSVVEATVIALVDRLIAEHPPATTPERDFLGAQFDAGLAWVHFPVGYGGLDLSRQLQGLVYQRLGAARAPILIGRNAIGYGMAAPTILTHGTEDQRRRYLRPLFTCEHIWCQLFSEPGAGSDVAGLATRADRDGDEWITNGQKVWTTLAHKSRYGMLLARSDPQAEKHKGLTYFVVDMEAPGVEVRPLRQMTGDAEFNEVYFTDVRIPDTERLGDVGEGWHAALTTLMNERVSIGGALGARGGGAIGTALRLWERRAAKDPVRRDRLVKLWIEAEVHRMTSIRAAANSLNGTPGPEGSTSKLHHAELNQRIYEFCVELQGADGMLYDSYEMRRPDTAGGFGGDPPRMFLRSRANSIEGGTSEVMRNILGERVLGLPGDIRVDKGKPWSTILR
jgi:alkylation response protein AidB-like acyl-CoA dehydrogenase